MGKLTTILDFFKRKNINNSKVKIDDVSLSTSNVDIPISENPQTKFRKFEFDEFVSILFILNRC
jgi:hypothetical protein